MTHYGYIQSLSSQHIRSVAIHHFRDSFSPHWIVVTSLNTKEKGKDCQQHSDSGHTRVQHSSCTAETSRYTITNIKHLYMECYHIASVDGISGRLQTDLKDVKHYITLLYD